MLDKKTKYTLTGILIVILIISLDVFGCTKLSYIAELIVVPIFAVIYFWKSKLKTISFSLFVGLYAIGDFIRFLDIDDDSNALYYTCNAFFMLGYLFLLITLIKNINFKVLFKNFKLEISVLLLLFGYMIFVLFKIIKPVTFQTDYVFLVQVFELLYNVIVILLLVISFLNYIQKTNNKNLIFFLGCVALSFSELVLIGYYYILDDIRLSYLSTILYIFGFLLIFYQSQLGASKEINK